MTLEQVMALEQFAPYYQAKTLSSSFIAAELGVSPRHVRRLLKYHLSTKPRQAWNRYDDEVRRFIVETKQEHPHYNCQWLSELTTDRFESAISRSTVYRMLKQADILNERPVNRTVRVRFEAEKSGDLVQMDTTWGYWWRNRKLCLIVLLDDYSRYIVAGQFVLSDTAWNNMKMIQSVVKSYGSFRLLYTDNASFFKPIRHNQSLYQVHRQAEYESEITRACREAGITHITHKPYQPEGKGKIKRLFRFIQGRFVSEIDDEMDLMDINTEFATWVDWYNHTHVNRTTKTTPKERFNPKGFTPLNGEKCLEDIFCFKDTRKVDKCNQFSYQGTTYTIPKKDCLVAFTVNLNIIPDRSIRVWHNNQFVCELPLTPTN